MNLNPPTETSLYASAWAAGWAPEAIAHAVALHIGADHPLAYTTAQITELFTRWTKELNEWCASQEPT